ncbi:MAG TPA: hypothetical protein VNI02_19980, partial [Blastocatellia bacterium]|nr:hypothetical protein [Blastocatellia bacterium]
MISAARITLVGFACLGLALSAWQGQSPTAVDPLTGIWASETKFVPVLRGEIIVTREGPTWRATLSGAEARFPVTGASVGFAFPGKQGQFRGALVGNGRT